jgi:Uma2 family endonuclease
MYQTPELTAEEFDRIVLLPENRDKRLEFIGGRIIEVVSNSYSSEVAATVLAFVKLFALERDLGRVTGADSGYWVAGERCIPDGAFVSKARQPDPCYDAYNPLAPDLAIEVLSPSDKEQDVRLKIGLYLLAGTTLWLFDPDLQEAEVYVPGQKPARLTIEDVIDGGSLLPGFKLALKDVFK